MWWLALPLAALAGEKIDLSPHYVPKPAPGASAADTYVVVERNGIRYKKFGNLYVIDSQPLSKGTISSGECFADSRNPGAPTREDLVKGEAKLTDSDVKAFAGLIQQTRYNRCDNFHSAVPAMPGLDLGVSKKTRNGSEYRVFNTNFGRNLNFSGQF